MARRIHPFLPKKESHEGLLLNRSINVFNILGERCGIFPVVLGGVDVGLWGQSTSCTTALCTDRSAQGTDRRNKRWPATKSVYNTPANRGIECQKSLINLILFSLFDS